MGLFNFKKKQDDAVPVDTGSEIEMPPLPPEIKGDMYSDLPSFPEGDEPKDDLQLPRELSDFDKDDALGDDLPMPPELKLPGEGTPPQIQPKNEPKLPPLPKSSDMPTEDDGIPWPDEVKKHDEPKKQWHAPQPMQEQWHAPEQKAPEHHEPARHESAPEMFAAGGEHFMSAARFRDFLDDIAEMQSTSRKAQNLTGWRALSAEQERVMDKFKTAVEGTQRKLLHADTLLTEE